MTEQIRKILYVSVDQWRGECLSAMGHPVVKTPHLDALAADGVLFKRHYAACAPCGPARASLHTGMYLMNHRSLRNGTPLDARHSNIALEVRKAGYDPMLFGYTDTSVDPRRYAPGDPAVHSYEGVLPGMTVGLQLPDHMAAWIADLKAKGYDLPGGRRDVYRPVPNYPGAQQRGFTYSPPVFPAEHSETTFMANTVLNYLSIRQDTPWFVHAVFLRPHPPIIAPEPYNKMYDPAAVPMPQRTVDWTEEAKQHPYLAYQIGGTHEVNGYNEHYPYALSDMSETELRQGRGT